MKMNRRPSQSKVLHNAEEEEEPDKGRDFYVVLEALQRRAFSSSPSSSLGGGCSTSTTASLGSAPLRAEDHPSIVNGCFIALMSDIYLMWIERMDKLEFSSVAQLNNWVAE